MSDAVKRILTIRYVNGTEEKFEYAPHEENALNIASRIQDALSANQVLLELEDRVLIIPFQNILSMEVSPLPAKLPPNVLRNVRRIE
jgi:hypothetical protein